MRKVCKYVVAVAIIAFLMYYSVSFKKLDNVKEQRRRETFNASEYARDLWDNQLFGVLDQAVDVNELIELFNSNMNEAIRRYGKAPGVSRSYAYLIKGQGQILAMGDDFLKVGIREPQTDFEIIIQSGFYIPGNAVRDASGLVDVSTFSDTMKFNEISGEINKIVVKEVIRPFLDKKPQTGKTITFIGATQVAQDATEEKELELVEVIPIRLELK
jgi:predicted lipoprotein